MLCRTLLSWAETNNFAIKVAKLNELGNFIPSFCGEKAQRTFDDWWAKLIQVYSKKRVFSTAFFCAKVQNTSGGFIQSSFPFILEPQTGPVLDGQCFSVYNGVQFSGEKPAASRFFFERARVCNSMPVSEPYFARNYLLNGSKEKFRRSSIPLNRNREGPTTYYKAN